MKSTSSLLRVAGLLLALAVALPCVAQQKYTISGYIRDADSGEELIGATVFDANSKLGTAANVYGFYSITLPADTVTLVWSFVGYKSQTQKWLLQSDMTINIELSDALELDEVTISATMAEKEHERTQMSSIRLPMKQIEALPAFLGERDVLKAIQLLPGVSSVGEGNSGLYVRGGGPDQNLILLDGVPVYNASHLFGFFSVFNPDALNSVELIKGGFPARYGGRLSSVLDIRMKEGNNNRFKATGSIGLVSSKLTLEGPLNKGRTSFIVSGRRTYIDVLAKPLIALANNLSNRDTDDEIRVSGGYYFYDLNAKINHKFSDKSRLFLSSYLGNDRFSARTQETYDNAGEQYEASTKAGLGWGNVTTALRWNYLLSKKLFVNTTLTYSRYRFLTDTEFESTLTQDGEAPEEEKFGYAYNSGIYDWGGKVSFDYLPGPNHYIRMGIGETYHTFRPGVQTINFSADSTGLDTTFGQRSIFSHEWQAYIEDDMKLGTRVKLNPGIHYSGFKVGDKWYHNVQPRISLAYMLRENITLKAAYSNMAQYLHLLTNATVGLPTDLWVPVTDTIPPMLSNQIAAGVAWTYNNDYEISVEGYYKTMRNVIEYKDGASFFFSSQDWQQKVEIGDAWSYGLELFMQRKVGKTTGWIGYTLSWTNRQFDNINFGEKFPYRYDRRHDVSLALVHKISETTDVGLVWVYGTGNAVTLPISTYRSIDAGSANSSFLDSYYGSEIDYVEGRNAFRTPSYHRMDVSLNNTKETKWGERTFSFGLYNAYSRQNPFYLYFGYNEQGDRVLKQISLFPILPFVSWTFKFDKPRA